MQKRLSAPPVSKKTCHRVTLILEDTISGVTLQ
jgi:hypothetical protein